MIHKVLPTGLHSIIDEKGRVHICTQKQYDNYMSLWEQIKRKLNIKSK